MSLQSFIDVYDEAFFDDIDGVTNALDNVKARKFFISFSRLVSVTHLTCYLKVSTWINVVYSIANPCSNLALWVPREILKLSSPI